MYKVTALFCMLNPTCQIVRVGGEPLSPWRESSRSWDTEWTPYTHTPPLVRLDAITADSPIDLMGIHPKCFHYLLVNSELSIWYYSLIKEEEKSRTICDKLIYRRLLKYSRCYNRQLLSTARHVTSIFQITIHQLWFFGQTPRSPKIVKTAVNGQVMHINYRPII